MTPLAILISVLTSQAQVAQSTVVAQTPEVWIYNAAHSDSGAKVDLSLDGTPSAQSVESGTLVGPFTVANPTSTTIAVRMSGGSSDLASQQITLGGNDQVLVVLGDPTGTVTLKDLAVSPTPAKDQRAQVSLLNASSDTLDFYLVEPNDTIDRAKPVVSGMNPDSTAVAAPSPGKYDAVLAVSGTKNSPVRSKTFVLKAGGREAVFAIPGTEDQPDQIVVLHI